MAVVRSAGSWTAPSSTCSAIPRGGEQALDVLEHGLGHQLARGRIQEFRLVLGGDVADDRGKLGA